MRFEVPCASKFRVGTIFTTCSVVVGNVSGTEVFLISSVNVIIIFTKNQKVWLCGRGDLTSLFFSKVAK